MSQLIQFEGRTVAVLAPEDLEELQAENARLKAWQDSVLAEVGEDHPKIPDGNDIGDWLARCADHYRNKATHLAARLKQAEAVIVAAQAVVDRWDSPEFSCLSMEPAVVVVNKLRAAIAQSKS